MIHEDRKNISSADVPQIIKEINDVKKERKNKDHKIALTLGSSYLIGDLNNVSDEGCRHLALGKWDQMTTLSLSNYDLSAACNNISYLGCEHFAKTKWNNLIFLSLGGLCSLIK